MKAIVLERLCNEAFNHVVGTRVEVAHTGGISTAAREISRMSRTEKAALLTSHLDSQC